MTLFPTVLQMNYQIIVIDTPFYLCYYICVLIWMCIVMAKEIYEKPIIEYTEYIVEEIMKESCPPSRDYGI